MADDFLHQAAFAPGLRIVSVGWRMPGGLWQECPPDRATDVLTMTPEEGGAQSLTLTHDLAAGVQIAFAVPESGFSAWGGGERFDALDLSGQTIRYYLENFGLGAGTYLPLPWIATSEGWSVLLHGEAPAIFHLGAPQEPEIVRIQIEGSTARLSVDTGDLAALQAALTRRLGPPLMPPDDFFGLWKAGDWRFQDAGKVRADCEGFEGLGLPLGVRLLDAYWSGEVHDFDFDPVKHPDGWYDVARMKAEGTSTWLWLCPWVVVGTASHTMATDAGYLIVDKDGQPITRRPGANPNIMAALIDYSNADAASWWSSSLRDLLARGIAGFKADFGEQLPRHAVLHSGETGGLAHNGFVRHYLKATIDAFDGKTPAIISRSGAPTIRTPVWSGDQTSDFCPKTGLPAAVRAVQSAALCGWSFTGSDLGGYFGEPSPQVFMRWTQFACFTPLMMLHGFGCREPWDMPMASRDCYRRYAALHLALGPYFRAAGRVAADGGAPLIRMMPLAFPATDWRGINDWDQQFMLGDDLLVAPVAFYGDTRAIPLPDGLWWDVLGESWVTGPVCVTREVAPDQIPVFVRAGATVPLAVSRGTAADTMVVFLPPEADHDQPHDHPNLDVLLVGCGHEEASNNLPDWFGTEIRQDRRQTS